MKIHFLEVFCFGDVYPKRGLVWQPACRKSIAVDEDNLEGTTNIDDVTCKKCLRLYSK